MLPLCNDILINVCHYVQITTLLSKCPHLLQFCSFDVKKYYNYININNSFKNWFIPKLIIRKSNNNANIKKY